MYTKSIIMKNFKNLKTAALSVILVLGMLSCSSSSDDSTTEPSTTQYDITPILSKFVGTGLSYSVNGDNVTFSTENLPDHKSPYWPTNNALYEAYNGSNSSFHLNPNRISSQSISITVPLKPSLKIKAKL